MDIYDDMIDYLNRSGICDIFTSCIPRTPGDDLRDIARRLINDNYNRLEDEENIPYRMRMIPRFNISPVDRTDVKIQLGRYQNIKEIMIKRLTEKDYIRVPFETTQNPPYIQGIIDEWFIVRGEEIVANDALFENMELYYYNKNGKSAEWFERHTEWIKFSNHTHINASDDQIKRPCGFKAFPDDSDDSE